MLVRQWMTAPSDSRILTSAAESVETWPTRETKPARRGEEGQGRSRETGVAEEAEREAPMVDSTPSISNCSLSETGKP